MRFWYVWDGGRLRRRCHVVLHHVGTFSEDMDEDVDVPFLLLDLFPLLLVLLMLLLVFVMPFL